MKLVFLANVYYRSTYGNSMFSATLYNGTIQITEPEEDVFAGESMFLYLMLFGGLSFGGYFLYMRQTSGKQSKSKSSVSTTETGTNTVDASWLSGTAASKEKSNKKKNKKNN